MRYLFSFIPAILTLIGNLSGGAWTLANLVFYFVVMALADILCANLHGSNKPVNSKTADFVLVSHVFLHTASVVALIYGIQQGILVDKWRWWAAVSTGLSAGLSGIVTAHELIHRKNKLFRNLGIWNLLLVNHSNFYVEHIRIHHRFVGTPKDAATARLGESLYAFFVRTVPEQWWSSFKENRSVVGGLTLAEILLCAGVWFVFGNTIFFAYLLKSFIAVFLLEYVNYVEHYGLTRNGPEGVTARLSWDSMSLPGRSVLLELPLHSDHHLRVLKEYQDLQPTSGAPRMPYGYFAMFYAAVCPPLWFRIMDPLATISSGN
jgi:alkane 1-monooxygenase